MRPVATVLVTLASLANPLVAQQWDVQQREIVDAIERLNRATSVGYADIEAYEGLLADDYTRWSLGDTVATQKAPLVASIREWLAAGWRVQNRDNRFVEITVLGDVALTRRLVRESYLGPGGETGASYSAVNEVWVRRLGRWLLFRTNLTPV